MSAPFYELDLKEKIEFVSLSPYECSQNLICLAFKNKLVVGLIKFQEEFDDIDHEVEFEQIEQFYYGQRVHAISWNPNTSLNKLPKTIEICAAGSDFSLRVFISDVSTKRNIRKELEGHVDYINDCAYDPEGDYLASVSDDLTCRLWQANQQFQLLNVFNLTSPGMCVAWHQDEPGKMLVGEKKGIVRLYNTMTLQPLSCNICGLVPLRSLAWSSQSKQLALLAAGELIMTDMGLTSSHAKESKMLHPGGGYKIAFCNVNDNYVATAGRPGTTLKITHVKNKQSIVSANIEIFGGFSWHHRLPCLIVGNNSKLSVFKISPK